MNKKQHILFLLLLASFFILLVYLLASISLDIRPAEKIRYKYILYWTEMFHQKDFNLGLGSKIFKDCPINNCYATNNKTLMRIDQFDAILFHGFEYNEIYDGKPQNRSQNQIYVYSNQESPVNTPNSGKFPNFFNWTMTYRLDSDVIRPYGFYEKFRTHYKPPPVEEIRKKSKKIAWMVSNCGTLSQREVLWEKINSYIETDVFGMCGNKTCSKDDPEKCYKYLEENYKFYLSFENSICQDYVTEKLYNVLKRNLLPIVYGGADYNKIAPPKSVIDVTKFKSVKELADYIKRLDENPEEYLQYFKWKTTYTVDTSNRLTLCSLCKKLNDPIKHKIYGDINDWFSESTCKYENNLPEIIYN